MKKIINLLMSVFTPWRIGKVENKSLVHDRSQWDELLDASLKVPGESAGTHENQSGSSTSDAITLIEVVPFVSELDDTSDEEDIEFIDYEEEADKKFLAELVAGTRYEKVCKDRTAYDCDFRVFEDNSKGEVGVELKGEYSSIQMKAYKLNTADLEILKAIVKRGIEEEDRGSEMFTRYKFETYHDPSDIELPECYHPHYSSSTSVDGNMYDDNMDTYGTQLGIMAVRCYLFFNTDTSEYVVASGRYYAL